MWASVSLTLRPMLYDLRRNAPQVPNLVYKRTRKRNERVMNSAASQLAEVAIQRQASSHNNDDVRVNP